MGTKLVKSLYTGQNEYSEIFIQFFLQGSSHTEIEEALKQDAASREALGLPTLKLVTIDNCCSSDAPYKNAYKSLNEDLREFIPLPLPANIHKLKVRNSNDTVALFAHTKRIIDHLSKMEDDKVIYIGLDMEWDTVNHVKDGKACILQLAFENPTGKKNNLILYV
jgi:hypothetical protein